MLEFAYTGEVNVAQELLPSLLHTAKSFRIKGLDKVENPVDPGPITRVSKSSSKSQIFVQKFNFDKTPTFSRVFHPKFF